MLLAFSLHLQSIPVQRHEFFRDDAYSTKLGKVIKLNIVPLTVAQLISLLPGETNACHSSSELLNMLKELLDLATECQDGVEWLAAIRRKMAVS